MRERSRAEEVPSDPAMSFVGGMTSKQPWGRLQAVIQFRRWGVDKVTWYQIRLVEGAEERFYEKRFSDFRDMHRALRKEGDVYLVDNSQLKENSPGLPYCASRDTDDADPDGATAQWGATVTGVDLGDGWLRVGTRYLPMALRGCRVLSFEVKAKARRLPALPGRGAVGLRHQLDVGDFNQKRELALQSYLDQVIQGVSSLADEPALDGFFSADAALCRSLSAGDFPPGTLSADISFESCESAPKEGEVVAPTRARTPF
jgi:hypothetical protein